MCFGSRDSGIFFPCDRAFVFRAVYLQCGSERFYVFANLSIWPCQSHYRPLMRVVFVSAKAGQHKNINVLSPLPPEAGVLESS